MLYTFLSLLSGGILAALAACRLEQISWKYLRLLAALALTLAVFVVAWARLGPTSADEAGVWSWPVALTVLAAVFAGCLLFAAPFVEAGPLWGRLVCLVGGAAGVGAAPAWTFMRANPPLALSLSSAAAMAVDHLSAAALLGTVTTAWLLGHAYLTASKMTIAPLHRLSRLLLIAVAVRAMVAAPGLLALWSGGTSAGGGVPVNAWLVMIISMRVGVGLVAVGVFAYMVLDCVRRRSTQSATGILYFASIFTYIGELCSLYLLGELG